MHGLACATETLTMLEIRQRDRLVDYYFVVNYLLNQHVRHGRGHRAKEARKWHDTFQVGR